MTEFPATRPMLRPADPGAGEAPAFLATLRPSRGAVAWALAVATALLLACIPPALVSARPMPHYFAFVPALQVALSTTAAVTAVLLFGQLPVLRSRRLLVLGCGYAIGSLLALAQGLSFPGVLSTGGALGGDRGTVWLYFLWHCGFAGAVGIYAALPEGRPIVHLPRAIASGLALSLLAVAAAVALVLVPDLLPSLVSGAAGAATKARVADATWGVGAVALALLLRRRPLSVLDLWLAVAMLAWLLDVGLTTGLNHARFDLGWYAGRACGLVADTVLLAALLLESGLLYSRLVLLHAEERRRSAMALGASRQRFDTTFEVAPVGIAISDAGGRWLRVNSKLCDILGHSASELVGQRVDSLIHPDDRGAYALAMHKLMRREIGSYTADRRYITRRGTPVWVHVAVTLIPREGAPDEVIAVVADVQARRDAEVALRESEQRFRAVFDSATVAIYVIDPDSGMVLDANRRALELHGCPSLSRLRSDEAWPDPPYAFGNLLDHVRATVAEGEQRFEWRLGGTSTTWLEVRMTRARIGGAARVLAVATDVTQRKRLEREVIEASTSEQERIGHDIHDGIGQQLTGLAMLAGTLARSLAGAGRESDAAAATFVRDGLQSALDEARRMARGLAPVEIDPEGLADALDRLGRDVTMASGIDCVYVGRRDVAVASSGAASHLYRIAQEAVQNAIRHAGATRIEIDLQPAPELPVLSVRDNGRGIDGSRSGGIGLHVMAYRASILGASLRVGSAPGGGTEVRCARAA